MKNSKIFFIWLIVFMLCCVIYLFKPFLLTMTIGILIAVATSNLHLKVLKFTNFKQTLSAFITTFILFVMFFAPFIYAIIMLTKNAMTFDIGYINTMIDFIKHFDYSNLPKPLQSFEKNIQEFFNEFDVVGFSKQIINYLSGIAKNSAKFIFDMFLIVIFYFFAHLYGKDILRFIKKSTPMGSKQINNIFNETANTMSVVFYSTIFNAVLQGFLFSIIAGIYGHDAILFGIIFAFSSLIPAIGGALVYVPTALYELTQTNLSGMITILIYCFIVISIIADSFIKPLVIKFINLKLVTRPTNINSLLIFFAMLSGISTFGFWGVILGPAILTLFIALLKLYSNLREKDFI